MAEFEPVAKERIPKHEAVQAWQRLRSCKHVPPRIDTLKQGSKGGVYRLHEMLDDGESIIAKRCRVDKGKLESMVYQHVLPALDTSIPQYFGSVDEGERVWLFLEDAGDVRYDPASTDHSAAAAEWLGTLHSAIDPLRVPDAFPDRDSAHYKRELSSGIRLAHLAIERFGRQRCTVISDIAHSLALIESAWTGIESICRTAPAVFSHNDCLPKNIHVRGSIGDVAIAPFDWGGAGWAPLGADLGLLGLPFEGPPETEPAYQFYQQAISHRWPDVAVESLRQLANIGQLFWGLKVVSRGLQEIAQLPHPPDYLLHKLAIYQMTLVRARRHGLLDTKP